MKSKRIFKKKSHSSGKRLKRKLNINSISRIDYTDIRRKTLVVGTPHRKFSLIDAITHTLQHGTCIVATKALNDKDTGQVATYIIKDDDWKEER